VQVVKVSLLAVMALVATPLGLHAALWLQQDHPSSWATADWSSTRTLPSAAHDRAALIRVYSARTGRWKGIFATHSWIVLKDQGAAAYERWDKVGWGRPVRRNNYAPDARWYGNEPQVVFELRGPEARRLIPKLRLPDLAGPELQHLRRRSARVRAGTRRDPAADGHRQGLPP
jgi:hypothetical protein